jgi:hypothetical protein
VVEWDEGSEEEPRGCQNEVSEDDNKGVLRVKGVSSTQTEISVLFVHKKAKCQLVIFSDFTGAEWK